MFGLGTTELVIILAIIVLMFGGKKLPQLGKSMGNAITNFKKGLNEKPDEETKKSDESKES